MDVWSKYNTRVQAGGTTMRDAAKQRETRFINSKIVNSLSYHHVLVDGIERDVAILNSDNLDEKIMISKPGETLDVGCNVEFSGAHWLAIEKDFNTELCTKVKLEQCNHLLKWVDENHIIQEQYCIVRDGTKYLTGEWEDPRFIVTRGDTRIQMVIQRNEHTYKFNRTTRFIIDDPESTQKLAYTLSKSLRVGSVYEGKGVYQFVLQEVATTDFDNLELDIADYYLHFPKEDPNLNYDDKNDIHPETNKDKYGKDSWL